MKKVAIAIVALTLGCGEAESVNPFGESAKGDDDNLVNSDEMIQSDDVEGEIAGAVASGATGFTKEQVAGILKRLYLIKDGETRSEVQRFSNCHIEPSQVERRTTTASDQTTDVQIEGDSVVVKSQIKIAGSGRERTMTITYTQTQGTWTAVATPNNNRTPSCNAENRTSALQFTQQPASLTTTNMSTGKCAVENCRSWSSKDSCDMVREVRFRADFQNEAPTQSTMNFIVTKTFEDHMTLSKICNISYANFE